ncbi:TraR/DksA family transcriptional regulator [Corallococcus carmarthensis]|uniref:TraR/DksA family transcriptional regulator n=1 Tax=Corallococcus carmarthensis TaxID=2316728 RepID=A0A3A8KDA9_9BACT|nr:TraR/DksA family transcriptional regulator [Corallococcus carmarthensis]NOK18406.1 TraR/DksA family transcriptional regulator [Corallococcus carmarthensis]RKG99793.1 TraR/DksA family transcriptional regulator [Corallococcus carmarthensis]
MRADPMVTLARQMLSSRRAALRGQCPPGGAASLPGGDPARRELEEVEAALARIERGLFGGCERCGGAIGRQRLLAVPEARCCLACAEARDVRG